MFPERVQRRALGRRVERGDDFVALFGLALQLVEDRLQFVAIAFAGQRRVAIALETRLAWIGERVADRLREQFARRIDARVGAFAAANAARQHRAVGREDRAALDAFLLEQRTPVEPVVAQPGRFEDGPARGEGDEQRKQQDHEHI